jgi:hypothetical protein
MREMDRYELSYSIMQEMTACPYKLDAQMYTYTMSIVDLDTESASEGLGRLTLKLAFQMSPSETSH